MASFRSRASAWTTYSIAGYADSTVSTYVANAKTSGANYVALGDVAYVDLSTNTIGDAYQGSLNQTAPLADVAAALTSATSQGLSVLLKPQLVTHDAAFSQYTSGSWINLVDSNLAIPNPDAFFAAYKAYVLKWAGVAEQGHAAAFSIGNEMVAATKPEYTHYWNDIISAVRQVYHGELTYSALLPLMTNSSSNEVSQIGFWDKLDFAGFDVYPSLSKGADPSVASLNQAWHQLTVYGNPQDYYTFVSSMATLVNKPVVFTETGLPSFSGASDRETSSDGSIGSNTVGGGAPDQAEQANWWQSFFQTWAVSKPSWLQGVFVYNNDPEQLGSYADQNYNVLGKTAAGVISAWFGGKTVLAACSDHLAGSQADDQLYVFGPKAGATLSSTEQTTVAVSVTSGIVNGTAPTVDVLINGVDYGPIALKANDSGYVAGDGTHWTINQVFTFSLPGLQTIQNLQLKFVSPPVVGGQASTTFIQNVSVNGVALTNATYTTSSGYVQSQRLPDASQGGSTSQWSGGSTSFDITPWNASLAANAVGSSTDPIVVSGGGGTDTLHVLGSASAYTITRIDSDSFRLTESSGLGQNVNASGVSAIQFQDGAVLDLSSVTDDNPHSVSTLLAALSNHAPTISGTHASTTSGTVSVNPFSGVVVADVEAGQPEAATITLSAADHGVLSGSGLVAGAAAGTYTASGTAAQVTAALQNAVFRPSQPAADTTVTTTFALSVSDTVTTTADSQTTVATSASVGSGVLHDLTGDGRADILCRSAGGELRVWSMIGTSATSDVAIATVPTNWKVAAVSDVTGDGHPDLIWVSTAGEYRSWTMNGTSVVVDRQIATGVSSSIVLQSAADFNGDGRSDLLMYSASTGEARLWTMNAAGQLAADQSVATITTDWKIAATGDFNGDGKADIVWRNTDGRTHLWLMNGNTPTADIDIGTVPNNWKIEAAADFTGDGKADILWRSTDGSVHTWLMNGSAPTADITLSSDWGSQWTLQDTADFNGDGKADILWRSTSGEAQLWTMGAFGVTSDQSVGLVGNNSQIVNLHPG